MPAGRPKSDDPPEKYRETYDLYHLINPRLPPGSSVVDEIAAVLEWAITDGRSGFGEKDIISIGSLAQGVGKSRNTAARSVERLVAKGMVVKTKPKSPYRIVSKIPIFDEAGSVADENISLTVKMASESYFSEVRHCSIGDRQDQFAAFLVSELGASKDPLIQDSCRKGWSAGESQYYMRVRTASIKGRDTGYLVETTFLHLPPEQAEGFVRRMALLRGQGVKQISMYPVLEQCGLTDLRAGRTQISVSRPPEFLARELSGVCETAPIDTEAFGGDEAMLKWTYALFRPDPTPMVTFSVCFVRSELLGIFIRSLDVELDGG